MQPDITPATAGDDYISVTAIGKLLAVDGKPRRPEAVWRDMTKGHLVNGTRVVMKSTWIGRRRVGKTEWVQDYLNALAGTAPTATTTSPKPSKTSKPRPEDHRRRAAENAGRELELAGI